MQLRECEVKYLCVQERSFGGYDLPHPPFAMALDHRKSTLARGSRWDYTPLPF